MAEVSNKEQSFVGDQDIARFAADHDRSTAQVELTIGGHSCVFHDMLDPGAADLTAGIELDGRVFGTSYS